VVSSGTSGSCVLSTGRRWLSEKNFQQAYREIDKEVAAYWKEHWTSPHSSARLGYAWSEVAGKIHIYCGDMDNLYLNDAVYLMEVS